MTDFHAPLPLKLRAHTPEELLAMSACLQDSLFPLSQLHYNKQEQTLKILVNRFRWEVEPQEHEGESTYVRVHTLVIFQDVTYIDHQNIDADDPVKMLNLLMVEGTTPGYIHLVFSGGGVIRLHVKSITAHFGDLHDSWPTKQMPIHEVA